MHTILNLANNEILVSSLIQSNLNQEIGLTEIG